MKITNFNIQDFLKNYWDKSIYFQKDFLQGDLNFLKEENLIEMACDDYYETRLIEQFGSEYKLTHGPFTSDILKEKNKNWTLFIHNIQHYFKPLQSLISQLDFLPLWVFDDILCSWSTDKSSVGAHYDDYNVFIIQLSGKRTWHIQENPQKKFKQDSDIQVLESFIPDKSFELMPGDVICIPPHIAHHGISEGESISLSVGFKSLEYFDLAKKFFFHLTDTGQSLHKLHSLREFESTMAYKITKNDILNIKKDLIQSVFDDSLFDPFILQVLSQNKFSQDFESPEVIEEKSEWFRNEHSKLISLKDSNLIYIDGIKFNESSKVLELLKSLFAKCHTENINNILKQLPQNTREKLILNCVVL